MHFFVKVSFYVLLIIKYCSCTCAYHNEIAQPHYSYRLPTNVVPHEYEIYIAPNLNEGVYYGEVIISVEICEDTETVTLHSKLLNILNASINNTAVNYEHGNNNFLILKHAESLRKGNFYDIKIVFEGDMKNKSYGFFRGFDIIEDKTVYFGATFFEPVNARTAFPCFDEPHLKSNFQIKLWRQTGYTALSNMNVKSTKNNVVTFHKTPKMSVYLVSFFVGNYSFVENFFTSINKRTIPLRIYTPYGKSENARYAVKQIPKLLAWMNRYTGFDYPLPKLDFLSVNPKFHMEGGMEDWGLISINSENVLSGSVNMSDSTKYGIIFSMAHEMGHLWFGDLVTLNFWNEFWLNEGFARFMDIKSVDAFPKYKHKNTYGKESNLLDVLWLDDDIHTLPLIREMKEADDVYDILNIIPYNKGSSILQMIEDTISPEVFTAFVQAYIKKHKYKNVSTKNLIESLQSFMEFNATTFLSGWTIQEGYPLVMMNLNETGVTLTQTRFLRLGQTETKKTKWTIPIKHISNVAIKPELFWLKSDEENGHLKLEMSNLKWIKLNHKFGGFYRVLYPKQMRKFFASNMMAFPIEDRMNLMDDSFALVRSGHITCSEALEFTNYLTKETNKNVWSVTSRFFSILKLYFKKNNISLDHLKKYAANLINKPYRLVGWNEIPGETFFQRESRFYILSFACAYGHEDCLKTAKLLLPKRHILSPNILDVVAKYGINNFKSNAAKETLDMDRDLSIFFGAVPAKLFHENIFNWPKNILSDCNRWFIKQTAN